MSEPMRHPNDPHAPRPDEGPEVRRPMRASAEDPLAELARILGESTAHPVRPENVVEVGRRVLPAKPAPQQVSDLEAELFESLRASVAPEDRVRGDFPREVPPVIPQHPVDDHDIASLGAIAAPEDPIVTPPPQTTPDPRLADYYAYDDGVAAGSWDPAFGPAAPVDLDAAFASEIHRARGDEAPRPTFDDFDTDAIALAARESSPYVAEEAVILPHSAREEYEAQHVAHEGGRGLRMAAVVVGVLLAGGGALAGWKYLGGKTGSGGPVVIHADTTPMKVVPEPSKAPQPGDGEVSLKRDTKVDGSKIVSLQEDPVEHVAGRTADGREVRVINPGAQRPANPDQPRTVKTVVVRPDGSIVSEDGTATAARPTGAAPVAVPPVPTVPPQGTAGPAPSKTVSTTPVTTIPVTPAPIAGVPPVPTVPPTAAAPSVLPAPTTPEVPVPMPMPAPPRPVAAAPAAPAPIGEPPAPVKPAAAIPAPVKAKPPVVAKPVAPPRTPPAGGAPMALGPVPPRLAATPAPATPAPAAPAPVTSSAAGDWVVQISASKSDADARRSLSDAQRRFSALAGKAGEVQRADLGAKGTYYRARFVAGAHETAAAVCAQVRAQGGQCIVARR